MDETQRLKTTPTLCGLPTELQHQIVLNLDPPAVLSLSKTNRWFHEHVSLYRCDPLELRGWLWHLEKRERHKERRNYACLSCIKLRPAKHFTADTLERAMKDATPDGRYSDRYCIECGLRDRKFVAGREYDIAGGEHKVKCYCASCLSFQAYFCPRCCWCVGCIAKLRGGWAARAGAGRKARPPCKGHV